MAEPVARYRTQVSGLWNTTHRIVGNDGELGVLTMRRNRFGLVCEGRWSPHKGEVLHFRRDPGILRSQFSLWTAGREWLGSSLRSSFLHREIVLHTGSRPLRIVPLSGLRTGWTIQAPRTGELARLEGGLVLRSMRLDVYKKLELEQLLFAYFLAWQVRREAFWPGPEQDEDPSLASAHKPLAPPPLAPPPPPRSGPEPNAPPTA
ncbi:MAG: hypothetical protein FJ294_13325 [Planctomycetes bacterium]|nr:hypothetical protein [Planctomycetota bacterium]